MRIGLFDPYLDTLGGGERYMLSIAEYLSQSNEVTIFWDDDSIIDKARSRFNLSLKGLKVAENIFQGNSSFIKKMLVTNNYDVMIFLSDGSIPFLFSKKNILLFQFPVNWIDKNSFITKLKLKKINSIICYSEFVKKYLTKSFSLPITVLPPAIATNKSKNTKKENIILSVGRYTKGMNTKKQEVLIDVFKKNAKKLQDWKLILAGAVLSKDREYVKSLQEKATGYPIEVLSDISYEELQSYYQKAKIYWHAAGFGEDLKKHPERAEHFGITTIEAMSTGTVPIVFNAGGQKEIVTEGESGFVWDTLEDLMEKTEKLMSNNEQMKEMSQKAIKRSEDYSFEKFSERIHLLIK